MLRNDTSRAHWKKWSSLLLLTVVVTMLWQVATATAQTLRAASDQQTIWLVRPTDTGIAIFHRDTRGTTGAMTKVLDLRGELAPGGMAAAKGNLWLVYQASPGLLFQGIRPTDSPGFAPPRMASMDGDRLLAADVQLWSLAVSDAGPWALVRARSAQSREALRGILGDEATGASAGDTSDEEPSTAEPPPASGMNGTPAHDDVLLQLRRGRWVQLALPADWVADAKKWIVVQRSHEPTPVLLALLPAEDGEQVLRIYRREGDRWHRVTHRIPAVLDFLPMATAGQLLAAVVREASPVDRVEVLGIYPEATYTIGALGAVPTVDRDRWTALPIGGTVALLLEDESQQLTFKRIDLSGRPLPDADAIQTVNRPVRDMSGYMLLVITVMVGFPLLVRAWRQSPEGKEIQLPETYVAVDMPRRMLAVLIDFTPPMMVVMGGYGLSMSDILQRLPSHDVPINMMLPTLVVFVLFTLHTGLSELFTGRSLGKMLVGLRVVSVDGKPPHIWQVLTRNALKVLELVGWPLLFVPIMRPYGQRLGDMLARTVVVADRPAEEDQPK